MFFWSWVIILCVAMIVTLAVCREKVIFLGDIRQDVPLSHRIDTLVLGRLL